MRKTLSDDEKQFLAAAKAKAKKSFNPARGTFASFMAYAEKDAMVDLLRQRKTEAKKRRRTESLDDVQPEPSIPSFLDAMAASENASHLVSLLPAREREVLTAVFLDGLTRHEAAEAIGIHPKTVSATRANGITRLRAKLQKISKSD